MGDLFDLYVNETEATAADRQRICDENDEEIAAWRMEDARQAIRNPGLSLPAWTRFWPEVVTLCRYDKNFRLQAIEANTPQRRQALVNQALGLAPRDNPAEVDYRPRRPVDPIDRHGTYGR